MSNGPFLDLRNPRQRSWLTGYMVGSVATVVFMVWQPPFWVTFLFLAVGIIGWTVTALGLWDWRKEAQSRQFAKDPADRKFIIIEVEVPENETDMARIWLEMRDSIPARIRGGEVSLWLDSEDYWESRGKR